MYHTIEFRQELLLDLDVSPKHRLERLRVRQGTRVPVQIKPYVVESNEGPVEVADLFFGDGTASHAVPFAWFFFTN
jgi:hypothetical protein